MKDMRKYHTAFGIHSNIPVCCVEFFIGDYDQMYYDTKQHYIKGVGVFRRWNYIPCPKCAKSNNKIMLHECTIPCIPFLKKIGVSKRCIEEKIRLTLRLSKNRRIQKKKGVIKWNREKLNYLLQDLAS